MRRERRVVFRMLRIDEAPEHVRIEIQTGEIKKEKTRVELGKLGVENLAVLCQHRAGLIEIFFIVQHAGRQSFRVLGNALGVELAYFFRQLTRIALWSGKRQRWIGGVDVYR